MEDHLPHLLGELLSPRQESEGEVEDYGKLMVSQAYLLDEDLMQEGAVVDDQCLVLLSHLLLLEDALERGKDALGDQLADDLVISNALLLESWIWEVAVFI